MMKVKAFMDALEEAEKSRERKAYKQNQKKPYSTKMPKSFFVHPVYQEPKEVIITPKSTEVIPRKWNELEIDFDDNMVRRCHLCNEKVYRVSNFYNYNKMKKRPVAIAVPLNSVLFEMIYDKFKMQIDIFLFIQISRRVIQESGYDASQDIHSCDTQRVLQSILSFLIQKEWIEYQFRIVQYQRFDFDLNMFLSDVIRYFNDEELLCSVSRLKEL